MVFLIRSNGRRIFVLPVDAGNTLLGILLLVSAVFLAIAGGGRIFGEELFHAIPLLPSVVAAHLRQQTKVPVAELDFTLLRNIRDNIRLKEPL
jgi:hypothetical protein